MIEETPRWPRSNYPKFNNKKFDYSRDSNLDAYLKTADRPGLYIMKVGPDKLDIQKIESVINKIIAADTTMPHHSFYYSHFENIGFCQQLPKGVPGNMCA